MHGRVDAKKTQTLFRRHLHLHLDLVKEKETCAADTTLGLLTDAHTHLPTYPSFEKTSGL